MAQADEIFRHAKRNRRDLVALCKSLVRTDTQNPPGDTSQAAGVTADFLRDLGWRPLLIGPSKQKTSLVASLGKSPPSLVFCSHLDVVPIGHPTKWKHHPLGGRVSGGRLYGRGAADAKGPASSMLAAAKIMTEQFESELRRASLSVMLVSDEEVGGFQGARWLLRNNYCRANSCIIGEPSYWSENGPRVVIGERGIAWFRLTALGRPAHASMPPLGDNAIVKTLEALARLERLNEVSRNPPRTVRSASTRAKNIMMRLARQTRANSRRMKDTIDHYTVNVGVIHGGTKTNVVPDRCQAEVDVRIPLGGSLREAGRLVRHLMSKGIEVELFNRSEPSHSPENSAVVRAVASSANSILKSTVPAVLVPYTSDAHWFREILDVPTCTFGPGYVYHVYNEFVPIKQLVQSSAIYTLAALKLGDSNPPRVRIPTPATVPAA